uniref:UPAR/Ly6 domain-containing protein n=1 Tax=Oryzias sinensis TaxID=183150 RepID=A0A8C7YZM5_9TELE
MFVVLLGDTLRCYECITDNSGTCTPTQKECPSENHQCGATRVIYYEGGSKIHDQTEKRCALPEECGEASVNFGWSKHWSNTQCCNSNLCNNHKTTNGRKCFTCDGLTCDKTLACEGNEDHSSEPGTTTISKGCVSEVMCSASNSYLSQRTETQVSCCKGNFCNSAVTASAGLQLVVVALVSLTLFS